MSVTVVVNAHPIPGQVCFRLVDQASGGDYIQVKVYAGPSEQALSLCGALVMRQIEWTTLEAGMKYALGTDV